MIRYEMPRNWIAYNRMAIIDELIGAKSAMMALTGIPYQRSWADELQKVQLKREVAGTSRIEGAEFTERELDAAMRETAQQLETRSQRQAAAAVKTYRWIAAQPADLPVSVDLVTEIHRQMVTGCDDDHCPPGRMREHDQNVTFGAPRHRGCDGGEGCTEAMRQLTSAVETVFKGHDPLIQALALHYHFAAIHPFLDGNGRTARALEALMLQRTGLRDTLFIAMSNYYYEHKVGYLNALHETREAEHELSAFLKFALRGIESQCKQLFAQIKLQVSKALFRNTVTDLFGRLQTKRKRAISERQVHVLNLLLDSEEITLAELTKRTAHFYKVKDPWKALIRDLNYLIELEAIGAEALPERAGYRLYIRLEWPTQITETEFFRQVKAMPKAKIHGFLST
ncbi:MAG: Fic family protein [Blastochloris sp.]|nr:Fic family protein [Blastochloris sp.]